MDVDRRNIDPCGPCLSGNFSESSIDRYTIFFTWLLSFLAVRTQGTFLWLFWPHKLFDNVVVFEESLSAFSFWNEKLAQQQNIGGRHVKKH